MSRYNFWPGFGQNTLTDVPLSSQTGSLAAHVLATFGIPSVVDSKGGNLSGLDIKHMDAMAVINLSLLEELAGGSATGMFEPIVNADGLVEFVEIGADVADLGTIYYQVPSESYIEQCSGVIVRGRKPLPTRHSPSFNPIWGQGDKKIWHTTQMETNCMRKGFSTHAVITFNDPHLDSSYKDGIDNLYDINGPYDKIIGYATYVDPGRYATESTQIALGNSCVVPIQVGTTGNPDMGVLIPRPTHDEASIEESVCWQWEAGEEVEGQIAIEIPDFLRYDDATGTKVDRFVKVENIMLMGKELSMLHAGAISASAAATEAPSDLNTVAMISMDNMNDIIFKLVEGKHYAITYDSEKNPFIAFAKDARYNEPKAYGANTDYIVSQIGGSGYFSAGDKGTATIFPVGGNKGILVNQIFALVAIDGPCITVFDPEGNEVDSTALNIADSLSFDVSPIIVTETPSPIAFNGRVLDQSQGVADNDPTTRQHFSTSPLERAYDTMGAGGGGVELTLPFLETGAQCAAVSTILKDFMTSTGVNTTYVCGPDSNPALGANGPAGGIINSISYSYTDSSSYTVSVNEGQRLVKQFSGGGPSGPNFKATESFSARGTVIGSMGTGVYFKVRIDGFGERTAMNMSSSVIKQGDVVQCSVHNNPVEA